MSSDAASDRQRVRTRRYKGVSTGTFLICTGAVFLLNTSGHVGWSVWWELLRMWPVLLIAAGLRMIFSATPLHFLSLAGPALVVAATAWVIMHHEEPPGWGDMSSARELEISCPAPAGDAPVRLRLDFAMGELSLDSSEPPASDRTAQTIPAGEGVPVPAPEFAGSLRYLGDRPGLRCGDDGELRLGRSRAGHRIRLHFPFWHRESAWEYRLSMDRPIRVEADLAAIDADLDLRSFDIVGLDLEMAAAAVTLRLGKPTARVPVKIDGAVTNLEVIVPEGTCYSITRDRLLSLLDADDLEVRRRRRVVSSACTDESLPRYELRYDLPISSVRVRTES